MIYNYSLRYKFKKGKNMNYGRDKELISLALKSGVKTVSEFFIFIKTNELNTVERELKTNQRS